jgi:hypothetical protein
MPSIEELIERHIVVTVELRERLRAYESGEMALHERQAGGDWIDVTPNEIRRLKAVIARLEASLGECVDKSD